jgi:hypothetical protein
MRRTEFNSIAFVRIPRVRQKLRQLSAGGTSSAFADDNFFQREMAPLTIDSEAALTATFDNSKSSNGRREKTELMRGFRGRA